MKELPQILGTKIILYTKIASYMYDRITYTCSTPPLKGDLGISVILIEMEFNEFDVENKK